jgi:hypothetical protein
MNERTVPEHEVNMKCLAFYAMNVVVVWGALCILVVLG